MDRQSKLTFERTNPIRNWERTNQLPLSGSINLWFEEFWWIMTSKIKNIKKWIFFRWVAEDSFTWVIAVTKLRNKKWQFFREKGSGIKVHLFIRFRSRNISCLLTLFYFIIFINEQTQKRKETHFMKLRD